MCAECGMNPCHPRCPNAPEPVPVHECVKCGYGILAGDKFWDSPEGNHINSYKRKKLNNRSPYETFSFYYGEDVLKRLGCSPVAAENIILKPKLLKK